MSIDQSSRRRFESYEAASPLDDLSQCEGFKVESPHGYVGVVNSVRYAPSARWDRPSALAVRAGHSSELLLIVQADQIDSVSLEERLIVLRPSPRIAATERLPALEPAIDDDGQAYWLRTCEGFRVDSKDGRIGVVEEIRFSSEKQPEALGVRTGLFRTRLC